MEVTVPDVKNLAAECGLVVEETGAELHVKIPAEFYHYTRNNSECDTIMVCEINGNHIIQFWYYFELLKTKLASGVFGYCWVHRSGVGNESSRNGDGHGSDPISVVCRAISVMCRVVSGAIIEKMRIER